MPKIKNVISGRQAKMRGQAFENTLHAEAYRNRYHVVPIPTGCKQVSATKLIRQRTPFDFLFFKNGIALCVDAKTTKANTYSFSSLTQHQVEVLLKIEREGFDAGYVVNFSELNVTSFFSGTLIGSIQKKSGLKPQDGIIVGSNSIINLDKIWQLKISS